MSTTFWIKKDWEYKWSKYFEVAFRWNYNINTRWLNELASLLPDKTKLKALNNSQQWINTIWDFKRELKEIENNL
jgi:hypothetical protein